MKKKSVHTCLLPETIPANASIADLTTEADRRIYRKRWAEWEPWILYDLYRNRTPNPQRSMELRQFRNLHRSILAGLIRMGLDMRTVRRNQLDDPRINDYERMDLLRRFLDRHQLNKTHLLLSEEIDKRKKIFCDRLEQLHRFSII